MMLGRSGGDVGNASIIPLEPQIDTHGEYYITLYYHFPIGTGHSINEYSALVKPFRKLMKDGKPIGKTAFVFYHGENSYYVIGSFAFTERIIFFPGSTTPSRVVLVSDDRNFTTENIDNIEHFTLEKNFVDWHVRFSQRKKKYPTQKTKRINDNVFLWFVMAISDQNKLEVMPKTQEYRLRAAHQQDLKRRRGLMLDSVDGCLFPVTGISYEQSSPHFLNFEFFVSSKKSKELDLPRGAFVMPPPYSKVVGLEEGIWSKDTDDFTLGKSISVSIRISKIRGSLRYHGLYFPGGPYIYPDY